ncbi:hypothetical protein PPIS_a4054 [Pseudoalteromonas piscicida]|uniref:Uncharacterized protein n=1 Tax=Pseudoalteromonas piscicida TaxID=43662 RepID=A0ABM6NIN8_PSEO7|nr:hypothetical protein PPIS_a4054 [Pseudoalteromonas piscicida]
MLSRVHIYVNKDGTLLLYIQVSLIDSMNKSRSERVSFNVLAYGFDLD